MRCLAAKIHLSFIFHFSFENCFTCAFYVCFFVDVNNGCYNMMQNFSKLHQIFYLIRVRYDHPNANAEYKHISSRKSVILFVCLFEVLFCGFIFFAHQFFSCFINDLLVSVSYPCLPVRCIAHRTPSLLPFVL